MDVIALLAPACERIDWQEAFAGTAGSWRHRTVCIPKEQPEPSRQPVRSDAWIGALLEEHRYSLLKNGRFTRRLTWACASLTCTHHSRKVGCHLRYSNGKSSSLRIGHPSRDGGLARRSSVSRMVESGQTVSPGYPEEADVFMLFGMNVIRPSDRV